MTSQLRDQLQSNLGNSYVLERELGGGAMSRVFVAEERALGRKVVVKVLPPDLAGAVRIERFVRELQLAARLQHPHIVPVLAAGETDGLPYYTMPFVEGESLRDRLARVGELAMDEAVSVLRDIASALGGAHARGIAHRDVKPANVLLCEGGAMVTDFGLAKALGGGITRAGSLTEAGLAVGTPAYMAPEQVAGDPSVDHRADIYAFGCLAYELLTGRPPFDDRTPQQLLAAHIAEAPKPVVQLRPTTPPALATLVMQCLEKEPSRRPQTTAELIRVLDTVSTGNGLMAPSMWGGFALKASRYLSWRRAAATGILAIGVVVLLGAGYMLLRALGVGPSESLLAQGVIGEREQLLVADFSVSGADTALGSVMAEAVRSDLSQSKAVRVMPLSAVASGLRRMQRAPTSRLDIALARELAQREGIKAVVDGSLRPLGAGYILTARLVGAESGDELASFRAAASGPGELIATIGALTRKLRGRMGESLQAVNASPPLPKQTTASLDALRKYAAGVRANAVEGDFDKAVRLLEEAVALDTNFAVAYVYLGAVLSNANMQRARRHEVMERAYRLRERLPEAERLSVVSRYLLRGPARDRARARAALEAELEFDTTRATLNDLAWLEMERREFARAERLFRSGIAIEPDAAINYMNLARALINLGQLPTADSVIRVMRMRFPGYAGTAETEWMLYVQRGQLDSAGAVLRRMRTGRNLSLAIGSLTHLARLARLQGRLAESERLLADMRARNESRGEPPPLLVDSLTVAQLDIRLRDRPARAIRRLDALLKRTELRSLPPGERPYLWVASLYAEAGRPDRARAVLAQYDAEERDTIRRRLDTPTRHNALADLALAERRWSDAASELTLGDQLPDGPATECSICFFAALGRVHDLAGRADSAIVLFERYLATPYWGRLASDSWWRPAMHRRLGELYELRGDRPRAAAHYGSYVDLWKDADPELQPKVAEVRRRLARLRHIEPG